MKQGFLVVHDYGAGGLWAVIHARSGDEIRQKYPFLDVLERRPEWMSAAEYQTIQELDIDDEPSGGLATCLRERG